MAHNRLYTNQGEGPSWVSQSRHFDSGLAISGLPRTTDIARPARFVRFVRIFVAKIGFYRRVSFGHLLRPTGFDPPTLTLPTQLLRYAIHRA